MSEFIKVLAAGLGIAAAWFLKDFFSKVYQDYVRFKGKNDLEAAKKKLQSDREKLSDSLRRPPLDG